MSENTETAVHFISHVHDQDTIYAKFECRAGRDAKCHRYPDCGCEEICEHEEVQQDECWITPWMSDACQQECFVGPENTTVHDGPIHVSFNGDCVDWEYLKEATL